MNTNKDNIDNFNKAFDLAHLTVFDSKAFPEADMTETHIVERAKENLVSLYNELYKNLRTQIGEEGENRDYDKAQDNTKLPKPLTVLPRSMPVPKPKPLTKWEKFRVEKGLPPKAKRSRMVYSEEAKDWVPRWGKGRYILI